MHSIKKNKKIKNKETIAPGIDTHMVVTFVEGTIHMLNTVHFTKVAHYKRGIILPKFLAQGEPHPSAK